MAKTVAELRQRRSALRAEAKTILDAAKTTNGDLTDEQAAKLDGIRAELDQGETDMDALLDGMRPAAEIETAAGAARAEGLKAGLAAALEIVGLCQIAGKPAAAHGFLKAGKSVDDVKAALAAEGVQAREDINARRATGAEPDTKKAWGSVIAKVNARVPGARK